MPTLKLSGSILTSPLFLVQLLAFGLALTGLAGCEPGNTPPVPGDVCLVDGKIYRAGDTFPSPDGCNSCSCAAGGQVACTLKACIDAGSSGGCTYGGKRYAEGDNFPSTDGCNSCFCGANGSVGCTKRACPAPAPKGCMRGGCSGQLCVDEPVASTCEWRPEYACFKTATCERQADGKCGWTKTTALSSCLSAAASAKP